MSNRDEIEKVNNLFNLFPARKNIRLPNFDYSSDGAYFVTIITQSRVCLFGTIINEEMILNEAGKMIDWVCQEMPDFIPCMYFDIYQIMPNHFHAIICLRDSVGEESKTNVGAGLCACPGQPQRPAPTQNRVSLSNIVQRFKSLTTRRYIDGVRQRQWQQFDKRLWQRNYYEHVIRDIKDYHSVWHYINRNPQNWTRDDSYPN